MKTFSTVPAPMLPLNPFLRSTWSPGFEIPAKPAISVDVVTKTVTCPDRPFTEAQYLYWKNLGVK